MQIRFIEAFKAAYTLFTEEDLALADAESEYCVVLLQQEDEAGWSKEFVRQRAN